jgi:hypothetical protein
MASGAQDPAELRVFASGDLYIGPYGSTLPTTPTASVASPYTKVGLISDDGVTFSVSPTVEDMRAWQRQQFVRREVTARDATLSAALLQWDVDTIQIAFGGGTITEPSAGTFRYDPPSDTAALAEYSLVLDAQDGPNAHYRIVVPRVSVTDAVETTFNRGALSTLPVTFSMLAPASGSSWYMLSDDAAFDS